MKQLSQELRKDINLGNRGGSLGNPDDTFEAVVMNFK